MKKLLATMLLLAALPLQASAATYYVKSGYPGNNNNAGTSITAPKRTMEALNPLVRPGDVVRVLIGSYNFPNPDSAGSNPTGGGFITYIGTHPTADPLTDGLARNAIAFTSGTVTKPYLSIKGVRINGTLSFENGDNRDSIRACTITGDLNIWGGDYNVIAECNFLGRRVSIGRAGADQVSDGNFIVSNHFDHLGEDLTGTGTEHFWMQGSGSGPNHVDSTKVWFNRVEFWPGAGALDGNMSGPTLIRTTNQDQRGNRFYYHLEKSGDYIIRWRDSTRTVSMNCDTVIAAGYGSGYMGLSTSGSLAGPNVCGNTIDSCYINTSGAAVSHQFLDGMIDCTITNNLIASRQYALWADLIRGQNVVEHNTLIGSAWDGAVNFELRPDAPALVDTNLALLNNIIGVWGEEKDLEDNVQYGAPFRAALKLGGAKWDSTRVLRQQVGVVSNHNAFQYFGYYQVPGDLSILINDRGTRVNSTPGDSTAANPKGRAENLWRLDSLSVYGSAKFGEGGADSVKGLDFDHTLGYRSRARGTHSGPDPDGGLDIGAKQFGGMVEFTTGLLQQTIYFTAGAVDTHYVSYSVIGNDDADNSGDTALNFTYTISLDAVTCASEGVLLSIDLDGLASQSFAALEPFIYDGTGGPTSGTLTITTNDPANPLIIIPIIIQ